MVKPWWNMVIHGWLIMLSAAYHEAIPKYPHEKGSSTTQKHPIGSSFVDIPKSAQYAVRQQN